MTALARLLIRAAQRVTTIVACCIAAGGVTSAAEPSARAIDAAVLSSFPAHPHYGLSVSIVHAERIVYERGFGYRDDGTPDRFIAIDRNYYAMPFARTHAARAAADARTVYAVGSLTKQFTAAALLLLTERHQLRLDDAVSTYAPEFSDRRLTIRSLLNQRSGLADFNRLEFVQRVLHRVRRSDGLVDSVQVSREIAAVPGHFAPGSRFEYSTSNYFVLGTIVERITHHSLGSFLATNIFAPLNMTRTAYATNATRDDVAVGYRTDQSRNVWRAYPWDLAWLGGAGALTSTVDDLARWDRALLGHRILQPASLAVMWHGLDAGRGQGSYAMGWIEDALGSHRYLWHNGEVGGFHSLAVVFPADDLAFNVLTNDQDANPEYLVPGIASLYFPVNGLDRILPRSGVVLIEASVALALGAVAIAIVALLTLKRLMIVGVFCAVVALVAGLLLPALIGLWLGGLTALLPTAIYVLASRFIPQRPAQQNVRTRS